MIHTSVDLMLDTSPYGTHTIASDGMWGNVPLLTSPQTSFASRVGGSLNKAVGDQFEILLNVETSKQLEDVGERIGKSEILNSDIRHLLSSSFGDNLFNSSSFSRQLEQSYQTMIEIEGLRLSKNINPFHRIIIGQTTNF